MGCMSNLPFTIYGIRGYHDTRNRRPEGILVLYWVCVYVRLKREERSEELGARYRVCHAKGRSGDADVTTSPL